ncbi:AlpA family phage regulatory protein [Candidatus Methylospira mobilis]|uniref:AlpA family phage regulatory protein n=1 Tax=Candidatus Methylospira mobilis TaxID=1808979 RepID=A0A5Q0BJH5_9GAMM|nr:AlpA family phage regulatory protein [Candidatus Methylospira mobilis]QFY42317.1 AlpA family phage regulatory protein [Candidatus Methylospira mobilis]
MTIKQEQSKTTSYIRMSSLITIVPLVPSTIWRLVKKGTFPQPVKLTENCTAWKLEDVQAWLDAKADASRSAS